MQAYKYTVSYQPGCNNAADILSRSPINTTETSHDHYIQMITSHVAPKGVSIAEITKESQSDPIISNVIKTVQSNRWNKNLQPYHQFRHDLSTYNGILLKGHQLVIPETLRNRILNTVHQQHLGTVKTKALLREKVWWPGMAKAVDQLVSSCHTCQIITQSPKATQPLDMTQTPSSNWQTLELT